MLKMRKSTGRQTRAGEKGQVIMALALILMLIIGLIIPPLLSFVSTSVSTHHDLTSSSGQLYAADAGIEDAMWHIKYDHLDDLIAAPDDTTAPGGNYDEYNYTSTWATQWSATSPYVPESLTTASGTGQVNSTDVAYSLQNVWIPKNIQPPPDPTTARGIIEANKLVVTGTNDTSTQVSTIKFSYTPNVLNGETLSSLGVVTVGVWLPNGYDFSLVDNNLLHNQNSNPIESDLYSDYDYPPGTKLFDTEIIYDWAGNKAVVWTFSSKVFNQLPPGGSGTSTAPWTATMHFKYTTTSGGNPDTIAWMTTSGVSDIPYSWNVDKTIYKITSDAGDLSQVASGGTGYTDIVSYTSKSQIRQTTSAIAGDYYAAGGSLLTGSGSTRGTPTVDPVSGSGFSSSTVSAIPTDADVKAAYLYWSAWLSDTSATAVPPLAPDNGSNIVINWNNGAAWSNSSPTGNFVGHYSSGGDPARLLTLKNSLSTSSESATVAWDQWLTIASPVFGPDHCDNLNNWDVSTATTLTQTNAPSTNTGSAWTDPTYAYASDTNNATITSGSPSGNNIWGNYGFDLTGNTINQVRVRYDAWSTSTPTPTMPSFQASGTGVGGTGAISPAWPAHQAGDIALLFVESANQTIALSTPAGFAEIPNSPQGTGTAGGTTATRLAVFWCRATSSSMSAPTVADSGNHTWGVILTFRNCIASGDPWDVTAGGVKTTASTTTTFGAVTTTAANTLIVLAASRENDSAAAAWSAWTNASLSGLTERQDAGTTSGNGGGTGIATGGKATAGNIGTSTATVTSTINAWMTIALKPATYYPQIRVDVSWNGGTTWSAKQITPLTGTKTTYWYDITSLTAWTPDKLSDTNFKVRVDAQTVNSPGAVSLDWLPTEVSYNSNSLWSSVSGELQGQGAASATDDRRTLTLKTALNLSTYSSGTVSVSWNQRASSTVDSTDHFYYALYNGTWSSNYEVFYGNSPTSPFSVVIPDAYLIGNSNFKIRFYFDFNNADEYVYIDNITIGGAYSSSEGLDFAFSKDNGTTWSNYYQAFRGTTDSFGNTVPTSAPASNNYSFQIPSTYLTPNFKMRFNLVGFTTASCKIDDIRVTTTLNPDTNVIFKINDVQVSFDSSGNKEYNTTDKLNASAAQVVRNYQNLTSPHGYSYTGFRDVTALVRAYTQAPTPPATNYPANAKYTVGDVNVAPNDEWSYAGWSLIIIYTSEQTQGHQLYLYDKFVYSNQNSGYTPLDVDWDGGYQPTDTGYTPGGYISGFIVPPRVQNSDGTWEANAAKITCFVGEGDEQYSGDFIALNAYDGSHNDYSTHPGDIPNNFKLWDGTSSTAPAGDPSGNPLPNSSASPNNVWNSKSVGLNASGIDVDTFNVPWVLSDGSPGLLSEGDTSARLDMVTRVDVWNMVYIILSFRSSVTTGGSISYLITKH